MDPGFGPALGEVARGAGDVCGEAAFVVSLAPFHVVPVGNRTVEGRWVSSQGAAYFGFREGEKAENSLLRIHRALDMGPLQRVQVTEIVRGPLHHLLVAVVVRALGSCLAFQVAAR